MRLLSLAAILAVMLVLAVVETVVPFHRREGSRQPRAGTNVALTLLTLALNVALTTLLAAGAELSRSRGLLAPLDLAPWMYVVVALVLPDFSTYVAHRLMHRVPALWRVHLVHHCGPHLDVSTSYRQHPIEGLVRFVFILGPAMALVLPLYAIGAYRLVSALNGLLEHVNVRLWQPLDSLLSLGVVTPNMHKVHHSRRREETDSNYGNLFSLFDRVLGTFTPSRRVADVVYGIAGHDAPEQQRLGRLFPLPFRAMRSEGPGEVV